MKKNKFIKREKVDKLIEKYTDKLFNKNPKISWNDVSYKTIDHGYFAEDLMNILDIHLNKKGKKMKDLPEPLGPMMLCYSWDWNRVKKTILN